jgi:hypothetical protein
MIKFRNDKEKREYNYLIFFYGYYTNFDACFEGGLLSNKIDRIMQVNLESLKNNMTR